MKLLSTLGSIGIGALLGAGAGYQFFKPTEEKCQAAYSQRLSEIEEQFNDVPVPAGVAAARDINIEYVISKEAGFRGLMFRDQSSGKQGVITKVPLFGTTGYGMQYADLEAALSSPSASVQIQPTIKLYTQKGK